MAEVIIALAALIDGEARNDRVIVFEIRSAAAGWRPRAPPLARLEGHHARVVADPGRPLTAHSSLLRIESLIRAP
jgi:hypothetical protein